MQRAPTLLPGAERCRVHPSAGPIPVEIPNAGAGREGVKQSRGPSLFPPIPPHSWQAPQTNSAGTSFPETREPGRRVPGRACTSQRGPNAAQEPPWQPRPLRDAFLGSGQSGELHSRAAGARPRAVFIHGVASTDPIRGQGERLGGLGEAERY